MAAIAAAEQGARVLLLDQMPRPGLKLLASGGGRANVTRLADADTFYAAFGRSGRFIGPALSLLDPSGLRRFLADIGVPTVVDEAQRVYPASQRAADVQAALAHRLADLGVGVRLDARVRRLGLEADRCTGVETASGECLAADRVVLACGGRSWPQLGGTGGGYDLARQAGHTVIDPVPALVPLVTQEDWPARLSGVALAGARVWIDLPRRRKAGVTGDVLFTHRGVSGPAVLDLSGTVARELAKGGPVPVAVGVVASMDAAAWADRLRAWRTTDGRKHVATLLARHVPASVGRLVCERAGVDPRTPAGQLARAGCRALADGLGRLTLTATATEGFDVAFVTGGGVSLKEVDPHTLGSRRAPGLYLAGEMLDLDGPTGGFNLQWAFASGRLAGRAAVA